jgi:hypothetical protein
VKNEIFTYSGVVDDDDVEKSNHSTSFSRRSDREADSQPHSKKYALYDHKVVTSD